MQARWIAVVAVFGAVWGATEMSLGALLRNMAIPMHGSLMAGIGIVIMLVARRTLTTEDRYGRGVCLAIGVVAAAMLPMSVSRGIGPAIAGILFEAACLEIVLWPARAGAWRYVCSGALAGLSPLLQMLAMLLVQYGAAAVSTFRDVFLNKQGGARLGLAEATAGTVLTLVAVFSLIYGMVCGLLGWSLARRILKRLGRPHA